MQLTKAAKRLVAQLDDRDDMVRFNAIRALGKHLTPELLPVLEQRLNDPDEFVRRYATEYYAELNPPDTAARMVAALDDRDDMVRFNAIRALGKHLTPELLPVLEQRLNDPDEFVRRYATEYYAELDPPDTAARMVAALDDRDDMVRFNAIRALGKHLTPELLPVLEQRLNDPDEFVRRYATEYYAELDPPDTAARMVAALDDRDDMVRFNAIRALGKHLTPELLPVLEQRLNDPDEFVRRYATEYYAELNPSRAAGRGGKRRASRGRNDQEPVRTREEQARPAARDDPLPTEAGDVTHVLGSTAGATRFDQGTTESAVEVVIGALSSRGGATPEELCSAAGLDRETVDRVLDELRRLGYLAEVDGPNGRLGAVQLPVASAGLEELATFLAASRAPVAVAPDGALHVRELAVTPPVAALDAGEARNRWLDAFVAEHLAPELADAARLHLPSHRLRLRLANEDGDVIALDPRGARIARITATRASVRDTSEIAGNFLAAGPHWRALIEALEPLVDDAEPIAEAGLHLRFPERVEPQWRETAEAASRRLRLERTLVYAHELRVDVHGFSLTFSPLTSPPDPLDPPSTFKHRRHRLASPLELPFTFTHGRDRFAGALRIAAFDLPLPCVWDQATDLETFALAWSLALASYAELTCPPRRPAAPPQSKQRAASQAPGARPQDRRPRSAARSQSGGSVTLPNDFRPRGNTASYLASYVAGHRRQLQPGHSHSPEAARNAAAVGITLRAGETWVQPHVRGVPADAVLHFSWSGPMWAS